MNVIWRRKVVDNATLCRDGKYVAEIEQIGIDQYIYRWKDVGADRVTATYEDVSGDRVVVWATPEQKLYIEEAKKRTWYSDVMKRELTFDPNMLTANLLDDAIFNIEMEKLASNHTLFKLKGDLKWNCIRARFNQDIQKHLEDTYGDKLEDIYNKKLDSGRR